MDLENTQPEVEEEGPFYLAPFAYLGGYLSGLIAYLITKADDKFARFHAIQSVFISGLFLLIYETLILAKNDYFRQNIPTMRDSFGPFLQGAAVLNFIIYASQLVFLTVLLIFIYQSYKGKWLHFPLVGRLSEKLLALNKPTVLIIFVLVIVVTSLFGYYVYQSTLEISHLISIK
jgi:uncharacterized membrane protein